MATPYPGAVLNCNYQLVLLEPTWGIGGQPEETNQLGPFLVRIGFKALGRNPYLRNTAQDFDAPAPPPDAGIASGFLGRTLAGTQYRRRPQLGWHGDEGLSVVQDTGGSIQVVRSFEQWNLARAARLSYWGQGRDIQVESPAEADTLAQFLVRRPFTGYGRNPYLLNTAQDFSFVTTPEADTWVPYLVRLNISGRLRAVPAYVFLRESPQDEDAPPIVVDSTSPYFPTYRPRRGR